MWSVRRRWLPHREGIGVRARFRSAARRLPWNERPAAPTGETTSTKKDRWYDGMDVGGCCLDGFDDAAIVLVAIAVLLLLFFVVPPVALIGIDLLWMGAMFLLGAIGRLVLGRPWTVEAIGPGDGRRVWKVKGYRGAGQLRDTLQAEFDAGLDPHPDRLGI